jgi:hypothetical protein
VEVEPVLAALEEAERDALRRGGGAELGPALAFLAGEQLALDPVKLHAARRRAIFLVAAGGDPHRGLELDGRAVSALAAELESAAARAELGASLAALKGPAEPFAHVSRALSELLADEGLAWRAYACALLAEELAESE